MKCFSKVIRLSSHKRIVVLNRIYSTVLGIETSCDDTGCAIVDDNGNILGESLCSQQQIHLDHGGILPPIARDLHQQNIKKVVDDALSNANLTVSDIDAIATTVKPGLSLSLLVGMKYGKMLSSTFNKPFIPIHHMEAHALTARMMHQVNFPFLVLLISGGHSILSVVQDVDKFVTLGNTLDDAPGEAFDKIARRLKLTNLEGMQNMSGGRALEKLASSGNPTAFSISEPLLREYCCNFSFAGIKNSFRKRILEEETRFGIEGDEVIPNISDLCASVQFAIVKHLCRRVQRAIEYVIMKTYITNNPTLVVSGGVACNKTIGRALELVCHKYNFNLIIPPPHLCTDNGVMIAWNGIERWHCKKGIYKAEELNQVDIEAKSPLGLDVTSDVIKSTIKCHWIRQSEIISYLSS